MVGKYLTILSWGQNPNAFVFPRRKYSGVEDSAVSILLKIEYSRLENISGVERLNTKLIRLEIIFPDCRV